jgi:hypothetical protein
MADDPDTDEAPSLAEWLATWPTPEGEPKASPLATATVTEPTPLATASEPEPSPLATASEPEPTPEPTPEPSPEPSPLATATVAPLLPAVVPVKVLTVEVIDRDRSTQDTASQGVGPSGGGSGGGPSGGGSGGGPSGGGSGVVTPHKALLIPTRESWLLALTARLRPMFEANEHPLPPTIHVSVGFPKGARGKKVIGQCWAPEASEDGAHQVYICPTIDQATASHCLVHELCHAALPPKTKHRKPFGRLAEAVGLVEAPAWTATTASEQLAEHLTKLAEELGPYPHPTLNWAPKPQKGRMRLMMCSCGRKLRLSKKVAEEGAILCGLCQTGFVLEGGDPETGEEPEGDGD